MAEKRNIDEDALKNGDEGAKREKLNFGESGTLLFSGATDWNIVGRRGSGIADLGKSTNTQWKPVRISALENIRVRNLSTGVVAVHFFAITDKGLVYAWGRNEKGQLGLGDTNDRHCPTLVTHLSDLNVVSISTGRSHSLFLTDDGSVFGCGDNKCGQIGNGKRDAVFLKPHAISYEGPAVTQVACGAEFSVLLDNSGAIWSWGHPEYGQLGHNDDGGFLEKTGRVNYHYVYVPTKVVVFIDKEPRSNQVTPVTDVVIKYISCGNNHTVALDDKKRVYTWGFGGYGRLGHTETNDEKVPRLVKFFEGHRRGAGSVQAGGQFNIATGELPGQAFMWGQYNTSKEANMYPKPIPDLSGWVIRSIACNGKGWIVAADDSVIGLGASPCYGELAMGENKKSSAKPIEIKTLDSVYVLQVSMGISQSIFIVRNESDQDKANILKFPLLDQSHLDKDA